jgi:long-chain acyl-CoA synthetase
MRGYWRDPDATAAAIRDGWLYTGDLGTLDSAGNLRLTGRAKDVIVLSSGKNIFPEELEEYFLKECPVLQEICFVGREGADGAVLHCVAVPKPEYEEGEVRREVAVAARELPSYKRPRSLTVTRSPLPRTSTRKLQRFRIREQAGVEEPVAVAAPDPLLLSHERELAALIRRVRPGARVGSATHLELDLHLDSLERVELIANVEKAFGIAMDDAASARIHTFGDLVSAVGKAPASAQTGWRDWADLVREPLTPAERATADTSLRRRPWLEAFWYGAAVPVALLFRIVFRLKVKQAGFPEAPFLLCPNHLSYLDDLAIACSLPWPVFRRMFALAASKYFQGRLATWLISLFRVLPIDEDRNLLSGLRMAKAGLERDLVLCIFPEGTRSADGKMQEMRKGAAILACALKIPVVPVGLTGTFEAWPRGRMFPKPHPVNVSYGVAISPGEDETVDAFHARLSEALIREVREAGSISKAESF